MSDRIAVFNARSHRAGRHAGRDLRAPGHRVRRRLRRHVEPARGRRRAARLLGIAELRSRSGPRRSGSSRHAARPRRRRGRRDRHDPRRAVPRRRHPLPGRRSTPAPSSSSIARTSTVHRRADASQPRRTVRAALPARARVCAVEDRRPSPRCRANRARPTCRRSDEARRSAGSSWLRSSSCSSSRLAAATATTPAAPRAARRAWPRDRQERRRGQHPGLAGYAENGSTDPRTRLGHAVREEDRLQGVGQVVRHLGRGVQALPDRPVRRRVGIGRRGAAQHRERRRRADQHRPARRTTRTSPLPEGPGRGTRSTATIYGVPHGWGANVLMWNEDVVTAGARLVGCRLRRELAVRGQDHRATTSRSTSRTPRCTCEDAARPRDHQPVRARPEAVRRRGRTC